MNVEELDQFVTYAQTLVGGQLQEVRLLSSELGLGVYYHSKLTWIWVDLNRTQPWILMDDQPGTLGKGEKKPAALFLRAHFLGKKLMACERMLEFGRVLRLSFGDGHWLQLDLFPHGVNLTLHAGDKKLAWRKPKELATVKATDTSSSRAARSLEEMKALWLENKKTQRPQGVAKGRSGDEAQRLAVKLKKLEKALSKINQDLRAKEESLWDKVGHWLMESQSTDGAPEAYQEYLKSSESFTWNLQNCFEKAKKIKQKILRTHERREQIEKELKALKSGEDVLPSTSVKKGGPLRRALLEEAKAKGRKLQIGEQVAFIGKSAKDNLLILRRAKAWDIWVHLRDFPSGHAVIQCKKGVSVDSVVLDEVVHWLISQTFGDKAQNKKGEKFDIIYAECRYVRPIKGDKVGRVTFSNERSYTYQY